APGHDGELIAFGHFPSSVAPQIEDRAAQPLAVRQHALAAPLARAGCPGEHPQRAPATVMALETRNARAPTSHPDETATRLVGRHIQRNAAPRIPQLRITTSPHRAAIGLVKCRLWTFQFRNEPAVTPAHLADHRAPQPRELPRLLPVD